VRVSRDLDRRPPVEAGVRREPPEAKAERETPETPPLDGLASVSALADGGARVNDVLSRCDAPTVGRVMSGLQATAGNRAATRLIQRWGPSFALPAPAKDESPWNDETIAEIQAMSDDALAEEEIKLGKQIESIERKRPHDPRIEKLSARLRLVLLTLSNRSSFDDGARVLRDRVEYLEYTAKASWAKLDAFVRKAKTDLLEAEKKIAAFLGTYEQAYKSFSSVLEKAKKAREERESYVDIGLGILIGTGLGLAGGALFETAEGIAKIAAEAGGEVAEAIVDSITKPDRPVSFEAPANLNPELIAKQEWQQIAQAWKGTALINGAIVDFATYKQAVTTIGLKLERPLLSERNTSGLDDFTKSVRGLEKQDPSLEIERLVDSADAELGRFVSAARSPRLARDVHATEQDIWIQWISQLPLDAVHETLDEDTIENYLAQIGVLEMGEWEKETAKDWLGVEIPPSRLGVDFGAWTSGADTFDAYKASVKQQGAIESIGRLGVAVTSIAAGFVGYVRMRHDAYYDVPESDPDPSAPERYLRATPAGMPATPGQVVRVVDASAKGAIVVAYTEGAAGRRLISISDLEREDVKNMDND
jgi:hypothetical protein